MQHMTKTKLAIHPKALDQEQEESGITQKRAKDLKEINGKVKIRRRCSNSRRIFQNKDEQ